MRSPSRESRRGVGISAGIDDTAIREGSSAGNDELSIDVSKYAGYCGIILRRPICSIGRDDIRRRSGEVPVGIVERATETQSGWNCESACWGPIDAIWRGEEHRDHPRTSSRSHEEPIPPG